jgi:TPR repeat protein
MLHKTMKTRWVRFAAGMVACTLTAAFAQTAGPQNAGIDAALLAKANAGDAASQVLVGESYAGGKGVAQDYTQAADWYRKAADKGDISGELHLAALYRDGGGKHFARDMVQAAAWYRKVADQGDAGAEATLGVLYSFGQGVPRSDVEAYFWLDLAAAVPGPNQEKYAANRQMIGTHITQDELDAVEERVAQWKAAHPRAGATP